MLMRSLAFLLLAAALQGFGQEVNLNDWTSNFEKVAAGARDGVQYNIYRKKGDAGYVYLEMINRNEQDVRVNLNLTEKFHTPAAKIPLTGFIKARGFWPSGYDKRVACGFDSPTIDITNVATGVVDEEQVVEIDADGKQVERYKYKFRSSDELKRDKRN